MNAPQTIPALRTRLVQLQADLLAVANERRQLVQGPGYYKATQALDERQQLLNREVDTVQKKIKALQTGTQATLL